MSTGAARCPAVYVPGASNPGTHARGCRRRRLQRAAQRGAARHRGIADVGARRRFGRRQRRRAPSPQAEIRDLSAVFLDRATPSYTALIDRDGDVIAGLADMELYELAFAKQLRRRKARDEVAGADAILCDANLPAAALERLAALATGKPLFAIAISPAKVVRLAGVLGSLACLFMNRREARR